MKVSLSYDLLLGYASTYLGFQILKGTFHYGIEALLSLLGYISPNLV